MCCSTSTGHGRFSALAARLRTPARPQGPGRLRELGLVTFETQRPAFDGGPGGAPPGRGFAPSARPAELGSGAGSGPAARSVGWRDRLTSTRPFAFGVELTQSRPFAIRIDLAHSRPFAIGVELAQALVFTGLLIFSIRTVVQNFRVEGSSMRPTSRAGRRWWSTAPPISTSNRPHLPSFC
jgi:hypothetical protein